MARRGKAGVNWTFDTLTPTLGRFAITANVAVQASARALAADIRDYMRDNAPWEDRTGDARAQLETQVHYKGFRTDIVLMSNSDHGIWLEIRWNGLYAIIVPTMEHFSGRDFWQEFDGMIGAATLGRTTRL